MPPAQQVANKVLTVLVWMTAAVCIGLLGFLGVGPRTGRYRTFTVLSGSMGPGIPAGAVVVDTPEPVGALRVGQVVTYAIPVGDHHVVTHRVVRVISRGPHPVFQTKGDANDAADPWPAQITGSQLWHVRAVVPGLGFAIHELRSPAIGIVGVVVLPIVLAMWWLVRIWRDDEVDLDSGVATP